MRNSSVDTVKQGVSFLSLDAAEMIVLDQGQAIVTCRSL